MSKINYTHNLKLLTYDGETIPTYLTDWTRNMEIIDDNFGSAVVEIPSLDARLQTVEEDVQTTMTTLHTHIATFTAYQHATDTRLDEVERRVGDLTPEGFDDIRDRLTTAEQNIISNATDIKVLEERISTDEESIADNKASIDVLSTHFEYLHDYTFNIDGQVDKNKEDIAQLSDRVTLNDAYIDNLQSDYTALSGEVDGLQSSDLAQAEQITMLGEDTKDLEIRVARLENGGEPSDVEQIIADVSQLKQITQDIKTETYTNTTNINKLKQDSAEMLTMIGRNTDQIANQLDRIVALEQATPEIPDLTELTDKVNQNASDIQILLNKAFLSGDIEMIHTTATRSRISGIYTTLSLNKNLILSQLERLISVTIINNNNFANTAVSVRESEIVIPETNFIEGVEYNTYVYLRKQNQVKTKILTLNHVSTSGDLNTYRISDATFPETENIISMCISSVSTAGNKFATTVIDVNPSAGYIYTKGTAAKNTPAQLIIQYYDSSGDTV